MSIVTRNGDFGETTLASGQRCAKDDARIETVGAIDELCAVIELTLAEIKNANVAHNFSHHEIFSQILRDLRLLMGFISGATTEFAASESLAQLDAAIATLEAQLPPLKEFLSFTENVFAARFNLTRTICRRAERRVVALHNAEVAHTISYLNRLSDFLFLVACVVSAKK